jgi:hypothetical protein
MLDEVAIAIATGAAGNVVAYMLNGPVDTLRAQVARMFRHATEQERSAALRTLEDDAAALTQQRASEAELTGRWSNFLLSYLTAHPEALGDIASFASPPVASKTTNIGSQNIYGSGIAFGGDNNDTINFNA